MCGLSALDEVATRTILHNLKTECYDENLIYAYITEDDEDND